MAAAPTPAVAGEIVAGAGSAIDAARKAAQYGRAAEIAAFLDAGALTPDARDADGCSLLQWAAINGRDTVVRLLLDRGCDVNAVGGVLRENALQWACRQGRAQCAVLLRESGGDPTHRGAEGGTAVHLCCRYGQVATLAYLVARDDAPPALARGLVDLPDGNGMTPLMVCCEWYWSRPKKALDCLRLLLAFGASATFADAKRRTPLHVAAARGVEARTLELLIDGGASCAAEDAEGLTACRTAERAGHGACARHLSALATTTKKRRPWCTEKRDQEDDEEKASLVRGGLSPLAPLPFAAELRSGPRACRDCAYGLGAPCVVLVGAPVLVAARGWHVGLVAAAVMSVGFMVLAPRDSGRYGHCGFAVGSVLSIARSFFLLSDRTLGVTTLYVFLVLCLFMCLTLTALSDPGVVCAKDDRSSHIVDAARRGALRDKDFCPTCLIQRPARAKHDPTLKRCVRRFDHYCPFVATVVGERNYRFFYAFLVCCVLAISLHLVVVLPRVGLCDSEADAICVLLPKHAPVFVGCILAIIHDVWIACMLVMHSSLVCTDQTTYEQMHGKGGGDCSSSNCRRVLAPAEPVATPASVELV